VQFPAMTPITDLTPFADVVPIEDDWAAKWRPESGLWHVRGAPPVAPCGVAAPARH